MYNDLVFYDTLITPADVADMLGIGMNSVYKLLKSNKIKAIKIGRIWKIPKRSVQEFVLQESHLNSYGWCL